MLFLFISFYIFLLGIDICEVIVMFYYNSIVYYIGGSIVIMLSIMVGIVVYIYNIKEHYRIMKILKRGW